MLWKFGAVALVVLAEVALLGGMYAWSAYTDNWFAWEFTVFVHKMMALLITITAITSMAAVMWVRGDSEIKRSKERK